VEERRAATEERRQDIEERRVASEDIVTPPLLLPELKPT
jgi:hypothetical protein